MALILFSVNSAFAQQKLDPPSNIYQLDRTATDITNCERGTYCNWRPSDRVVTYCDNVTDNTRCRSFRDSVLTIQLTKSEKKAYKNCLERTPHCTFLSDYGKDNKNISWKMPNTNVTRYKRVSQWIALGTVAEEKARRKAKDQAAKDAMAFHETLRKNRETREANKQAKLKACVDKGKSNTYCNCIDSNPGKSSFCSCRVSGRTKAECNCDNQWGSLPSCKAPEGRSKTKFNSKIKVRAQFNKNGKFLNCYASLNPQLSSFNRYSQGSNQSQRAESTLYLISSSNNKSKLGTNLYLGLHASSKVKSFQPIVLDRKMRKALNFNTQSNAKSLHKKYKTLRAQNNSRSSTVDRDPILKIDTTFPQTTNLPTLAVTTVSDKIRAMLGYSEGSFLLIYNITESNTPIHIGKIQLGRRGLFELSRCVADNSNSATLTTSGVAFSGLHRIENRWKPNKAINIETGSLVAGPIHNGASSSQWELIPVTGTKFYQLKNYWKKTILNIETKTGVPKMTAINEGGRSTHWELIPIANSGFFQIKNRWMGTYLNVETGSLTASDVPSAFLSAHWSLKKL